MTPNTLQLYLGNGQALNRRCFLNIIMFFCILSQFYVTFYFLHVFIAIIYLLKSICNYIIRQNSVII